MAGYKLSERALTQLRDVVRNEVSRYKNTLDSRSQIGFGSDIREGRLIEEIETEEGEPSQFIWTPYQGQGENWEVDETDGPQFECVDRINLHCCVGDDVLLVRTNGEWRPVIIFPSLWRLEDCHIDPNKEKMPDLWVTNKLEEHKDKIVLVGDTCYTIHKPKCEEIPECLNPKCVEILGYYEECEKCKSCWKLTECVDDYETEPQEIITTIDLSEYEGLVVKIDGHVEKCWEVSHYGVCPPDETQNDPVTVIEYYDDCETCGCYTIYKCGRGQFKVITNNLLRLAKEEGLEVESPDDLADPMGGGPSFLVEGDCWYVDNFGECDSSASQVAVDGVHESCADCGCVKLTNCEDSQDIRYVTSAVDGDAVSIDLRDYIGEAVRLQDNGKCYLVEEVDTSIECEEAEEDVVVLEAYGEPDGPNCSRCKCYTLQRCDAESPEEPGAIITTYTDLIGLGYAVGEVFSQTEASTKVCYRIIDDEADFEGSIPVTPDVHYGTDCEQCLSTYWYELVPSCFDGDDCGGSSGGGSGSGNSVITDEHLHMAIGQYIYVKGRCWFVKRAEPESEVTSGWEAPIDWRGPYRNCAACGVGGSSAILERDTVRNLDGTLLRDYWNEKYTDGALTAICPTNQETLLEPGCGLKPVAGDSKKWSIDAAAIVSFGLAAGVDECTIQVKPGCGTLVDNDGVHVDPVDVAGNGLMPVPGGECGIQVDPGCGIIVDADGVHVDAAELAGTGLEPQGTCSLAVSFGCGLNLGLANEIVFDADHVAGPGLENSDEECELGVKTGCGLAIDEADNSVKINPNDLAGDGLLVEGIEGCGLKVNEGCGITVDENGVHINRDDIVGTGLVAEVGGCAIGVDTVADDDNDKAVTVLTDVSLSIEGCLVKLHRKTRTLTYKHNADNVLIGVAVGDEQDLPDSQVDVSECCCLEDSLWELEPCEGGGGSILVLRSVLTLVAPPELGGVYEDTNGDCWEVIAEDAEGEADEFEPARYYAPGGDPCSECPAPPPATLYELEPCEGGESIIVDGDDLTEPEIGAVYKDDQGECWIVTDDDAEGEPTTFVETANFPPGDDPCGDCAGPPPATLYHLRLCDDVNTQLVVSGDDLTTPEIGAVYKDANGDCWIVFNEDVAGPADAFTEVEYFPPEGNPCETCTTPDPDFRCGDYCLAAANGYIEHVSLDGIGTIPLAETLTYSDGKWTGQFVLSGTGNDDCNGTYNIEIKCNIFNELRLWVNGVDQTNITSAFSSGGYHIFDGFISMPSPCGLSGSIRLGLPIGDCPP